jgi:L-lactate dehydrogenase
VLTDAMGRRTHGLAMSPLYLADAAKGGMHVTGSPDRERQRPLRGVGRRLPARPVAGRAGDRARHAARASSTAWRAIAIRRATTSAASRRWSKQAADKASSR